MQTHSRLVKGECKVGILRPSLPTDGTHDDAPYRKDTPIATDPTFVCPTCDKQFRTEPQLTAHRRSHSGGNSFECMTCGQCFSHASGLSRHKKVHVDYVCKECGK
ncbi:unnamed protein product [Ixodes hexagonus]